MHNYTVSPLTVDHEHVKANVTLQYFSDDNTKLCVWYLIETTFTNAGLIVMLKPGVESLFSVLYNCCLSDCAIWAQWDLEENQSRRCFFTSDCTIYILYSLVMIDSVDWPFTSWNVSRSDILNDTWNGKWNGTKSQASPCASVANVLPKEDLGIFKHI